MPILNGRRHDWVSVVITLPSLARKPVTASTITYPSHGQAKEHVYGTGGFPVGYTRDAYKVDDLQIELLQAEMDEIRAQLGPGYGAVELPVTISYADTGLAVRTDRFIGCHITGEQPSVSQGTDPARVQVTLRPDEMVLGGVPYTVKASV